MALHLRYLQTLTDIAAEKNSTILFPVPIDWMKRVHEGTPVARMEGYSPEPVGPDDDLTIRGEVGDTSVAELLRSLLGSGETGILTLRNGDVTKSIYIQGGRVLFAASTNVDERLGESLLLRGRITARQYVEASKMIRPGRRLGAILVEMAALEPEELIPAVEHQVKEVLLDLFTWTHGTYELVIKDVDPESVVTVNISTENLLLEGMRRVRSWSQLMRGLGDIGIGAAPGRATPTTSSS